MRIKMIGCLAGTDRVWRPGQVYETDSQLTEATARRLIEKHEAVEVDENDKPIVRSPKPAKPEGKK